MNSQVAAQQGDTIDIWNLPTFKPASGPYHTNWTSVTKYRTPHWYRDAKFGYWAHWDPQTVPEGGDWFARSMYTPGSDQYRWTTNKFGNINEYGYKDICNLWKCDKWDPDYLMRLCLAGSDLHNTLILDIPVRLHCGGYEPHRSTSTARPA
jgi:hypothetical protein